MMHAMPYVLISTFLHTHTHTHASNAKRYLFLASSHYGKLRCCAVNRWVGVRMYEEQNRIFVQCVRRPENIRFASSSSSSSMFDLAVFTLSPSLTHTPTQAVAFIPDEYTVLYGFSLCSACVRSRFSLGIRFICSLLCTRRNISTMGADAFA